MIDFAWILLLAALLDAAFGDPVWLYRALPHPVALIGRLIGWLDRRFNDPLDPECTAQAEWNHRGRRADRRRLDAWAGAG